MLPAGIHYENLHAAFGDMTDNGRTLFCVLMYFTAIRPSMAMSVSKSSAGGVFILASDSWVLDSLNAEISNIFG